MISNTINASAILLIHCPDRKGLVLSVTEFIHTNGGNIIYLDQHVDYQNKVFFMRIEWDLKGFLIPREKIGEYFKNIDSKKVKNELAITFFGFSTEDGCFCFKTPPLLI